VSVIEDGVYALLIDGSTVLVREAGAEDEDAVRQMHERMSPANVYLRFFNISPRMAALEARRVCRPADDAHCALLAWLGDELAGVGSFEPTSEAGVGEISFAVADHLHGRGVASLLLDHLVSIARLRGLHAFTADTLGDNLAMLRVFGHAGLSARRQMSDGVVHTWFPLPADETDRRMREYLDSVAARERTADVASLRHLLEPASVAVVGASRRPGGVGHAILRNLVNEFDGRLYAVNPNAVSILGARCVATVADLPEPVDLAVIAVPPASVVDVARECGRRGVRSVAVITAGIEPAVGAGLLTACREHGVRLLGPNCFGVAVPALRLNATFAADRPSPGTTGLVVQSGGIGVALLRQLASLGLGVSSFVSVGDKYDVSSNDMLLWWEQDGRTSLAVLYLESFGSPRRFARTARRVCRAFPVLTVIAGRSAAGRLAVAEHTASGTAVALNTQQALFEQAGIIATASLGELTDTAVLLASQPLPAGNRVAIVSTAGGVGALAADACADHGLAVATLSDATRRRLAAILPDAASVAGPVATTATVSAQAFAACIALAAGDDNADAVMAITVPTALGDLAPVIMAAQQSAKPLVAVLLDQEQAVRLLPGTSGQSIPAYRYPEAAAGALGRATRYAAWRSTEPGEVPELAGISHDAARSVIAAFVSENRLGGWLPPGETAALLDCYGIGSEPPTGAELTMRAVHDPVFGPVISLGVGGAGGILANQATRLTPLTDADADQMIRVSGAAALLTDSSRLADQLLRVSRLADDFAEIAELAFDPPSAARIRLVPAEPQDPFLRRLR
jgi:acyl-CoA synthetase (NDP forming)/GNAT superfamily N-acetyltransferase